MTENERKLRSSLLVNIGKATLAAVMAIKVVSHEGSSTALSVRALLPKPLNLTAVIDLIELKDCELHLLMLVLDLLGLGVGLLLPLLGTTAEAEDKVEG
ncbi:hypothetical protein PIB30_117824 [Stylosanthes scabra]|uniref:Uncharacterized protein n=1 Tax=Stylosanthes scabra TaxID=79078 RepID=A0ABU6W449_9FABA|nr:hypothetical protein [Stylosanthes scabra]